MTYSARTLTPLPSGEWPVRDAADWGYQRGWKGTAKPNPYLPGSSSAVAYDKGYERGKTDAAERERDAWGGSRCAFCHHLIRRKEAGWAAEDPCGCPQRKCSDDRQRTMINTARAETTQTETGEEADMRTDLEEETERAANAVSLPNMVKRLAK